MRAPASGGGRGGTASGHPSSPRAPLSRLPRAPWELLRLAQARHPVAARAEEKVPTILGITGCPWVWVRTSERVTWPPPSPRAVRRDEKALGSCEPWACLLRSGSAL